MTKHVDSGLWIVDRGKGTAPSTIHYPLSTFSVPRATDAVNAEGAAVATPAAAPSLAALLTRHILRDGELVILLLKPSLWFIILSSLRFAGIVLLLMIGTKVFDDYLPPLNRLAVMEAGIFLIAGRVMWAVLQWSGRLYVLTDLRIVAISGVFNVQIFDCPLRKIARTRLVFSSRERIFRLGSIEIIPLSDDQPDGLWQTIARPKQVHEQIVATINKAKQGGCLT